MKILRHIVPVQGHGPRPLFIFHSLSIAVCTQLSLTLSFFSLLSLSFSLSRSASRRSRSGWAGGWGDSTPPCAARAPTPSPRCGRCLYTAISTDSLIHPSIYLETHTRRLPAFVDEFNKAIVCRAHTHHGINVSHAINDIYSVSTILVSCHSPNENRQPCHIYIYIYIYIYIE